jgi:hypothetical protein
VDPDPAEPDLDPDPDDPDLEPDPAEPDPDPAAVAAGRSLPRNTRVPDGEPPGTLAAAAS